MSQNDQDRDRKNQDAGYQDKKDETLREGSGNQDRSSDSGEADDMDEDRDDDLRGDGSFDRRNNIG